MVPILSYHSIEAINLSRERSSTTREVAKAITARERNKAIRIIRNQRSEESN